MVRKFMERDIDGKDAWIYTGTHGTKGWMNEDNPAKRNVRIPAAYWKGRGLDLDLILLKFQYELFTSFLLH